MNGARQRPALGPPRSDLARFPRSRLRAETRLYRAHTAGNSPWWFSSDLSGRFDLIVPDGTCHLSTDIPTALRERFGHNLVRQGVVTFEAAARTTVSALRAPSARWLANTCAPGAAGFGMTREIGTCAAYDFPQAWAAAFLAAGKVAGVRYQARFSTSRTANAVALFGAAGHADWPLDPGPLAGVAACGQAGITVAHRPVRRQVRVILPPGR